MDLSERISTLRSMSGLSARQLATLVDVAPTTVTRIEAGRVSPSFDLVQEMLTVLGEPIGFTGLADASVVAAARLALDPVLDIQQTPELDRWWQRWARLGLIDDCGRVTPGMEADLLFQAGRAARLTRRRGAVDFEVGPGAHEIAEALSKAGIDYAVTGDAGANVYRSSAGAAWPVLYVDDITSAAATVGLVRKKMGAFGMRVTLIPFDGVSELGRRKVASVTVAARDQVLLDAYGGVGRMAEQADILLGRRVA